MSTKHYHGSCQCGAVDFDVDIDLGFTAVCNCSRCRRLGSVLAFTSPSDFTLNSGADVLTDYLFNKHTIRHQFCSVCGIEAFAFGKVPGDGSEMVAVNVNCLDGVDARSLPSKPFDGASL
ncbi:GFA family protein [Martelella alba]|uniref:GFA family protein n=1 Tax=Martelella alba TaxID=2590451 RepID=A0A506UCU4_9HYPH|nr:GFA family protein [Martelella alba]TPW31418.1 GFA family protein [Martelella alba]